jgi:ribosomal protein L7/L12
MANELTDEQVSILRGELRTGGKLAAVKLYKEWTGSSLLTAKNFVESLAGPEAGTADFGMELEDGQMDQILDALQEGNKLEAVKLYRNSTGLSLMESKQFVERLMKELGVEDRAGCAKVILLAVVIGAALSLTVA